MSYRALLGKAGMLPALVVFVWSCTLGEAIAAGKSTVSSWDVHHIQPLWQSIQSCITAALVLVGRLGPMIQLQTQLTLRVTRITGGWAFSTRDISVLMACVGMVGSLWSATGVGMLNRRYGPVSTMVAAGPGYILNFGWPILANELLRHGQASIFWALIPFFVTIQACNAAITGSQSHTFKSYGYGLIGL